MKNRRNRLISCLLVVAMGVSFSTSAVACGSNEVENTEIENNSVQTEIIIPDGYSLVWNDEFEGNSLDTTKWSYQIGDGGNYGLTNWGNGESEYYTDREENINVTGGLLTINALKEKSLYEGYSYTSARIRTITDDNEVLFATTYGRVEARAKVVGGSGIWPAFWMLPVDSTTYGGWASSGELDIMELRGRLPGNVTASLHYGRKWPENVYSNKDYTFKDGNTIHDFHTYAVEWDPTEIRWYVDDECYFKMNDWYSAEAGCYTNFTYPAPYDVPFYIVLNLAVGGNFDPDAVLTDKSFPAQMQVDYVRVFHRNEGYDSLLQEAYDKTPEIEADLSKEKHPNNNLIYNYSFDQGKNRMAYWSVNAMTAEVLATDMQHRLSISDTKEGASLKQTGFALEKGSSYGVRFNAGVESGNESTVVVKITDSNGKIVSKNKIELKVADDYVYAYKFESDVTDSLCSITLEFEKNKSFCIDKVIMMPLN